MRLLANFAVDFQRKAGHPPESWQLFCYDQRNHFVVERPMDEGLCANPYSPQWDDRSG